MPCFHPVKGWRAKTLNPTGKRSIVFNEKDGYSDFPVTVPCGRCMDCRLSRSRVWAIRCVHEAQLHSENSFITLTYSDDKIPNPPSLVKSDFQKFMKRLRKENSDRTIRFFHCGEYGDKFSRPHYHACLFGYQFPDRELLKVVRDIPLYTSEKLKRLWPLGHSTIGELTFESAAYVARYITKKQTGKGSEIFYRYIDEGTGEVSELEKEYVTMSRRPGIGKAWFEKYGSDVFPHDYVVMRGKKMKPPKFYFDLLEKEHKKTAKIISLKRQEKAQQNLEENSWERLAVKEEILYERLTRLKRE